MSLDDKSLRVKVAFDKYDYAVRKGNQDSRIAARGNLFLAIAGEIDPKYKMRTPISDVIAESMLKRVK